ncbi:MAG: helix-turn-helix domain-containing protein [Pirellulales bacterium]
MATVPFKMTRGTFAFASTGLHRQNDKPLHRIKEVRKEQGISVRTTARRLGVGTAQVREEERTDSDLLLSQVYRWQQALDVPVADLMEEPENELSSPVRERAHMVRVMKTAKSISERASEPNIRILAQTLINQLTQLMPELADVNSWNNVGQRRSLDEYGKIMERSISEDAVLRMIKDS